MVVTRMNGNRRRPFLISIYFFVIFITTIAIAIRRAGKMRSQTLAYSIFSNRAIYYSLQSIGSDFLIVFPWKLAYPTCMNDKEFLVCFIKLYSIRTLAFCIPELFTVRGTNARKIFKSLFEVIMFTCFFLYLPHVYKKHWRRQGKLIFFIVPAIIYACASGIAVYWKIQALFEAASILYVVCAFFIVFDSRKYISRDYGYILCYGLLAYSFPSLLGQILLQSLSATTVRISRILIYVLWTLMCYLARILWFRVAAAASYPKVAFVLLFPLQISIDIFDELFFSVVNWKSREFVLLLTLRVSINFLYNAGLISSHRLYVTSSLGESEKLAWHFQLLEQNLVTESIASIFILSAYAVDMVFDALSFGGKTISRGMTASRRWNAICTNCIVIVGILLSCHAAEQVLKRKWTHLRYNIETLSWKKIEAKFWKGPWMKNTKHGCKVQPTNVPPTSELEGIPEEASHAEAKHEVECVEKSPCSDMHVQVIRQNDAITSLHTLPRHIDENWSTFWYFYLCAVSFTILEVIYRVMKVNIHSGS